MLARLQYGRDRYLFWWTTLEKLTTDALLYGLAAVFALVLGIASTQHAQWQWGYLAAGPYALAAVLAFAAAGRRWRHQRLTRLVLVVFVLVGAVVAPLALEVKWRQAQPEVGVISRAGQDLARGVDPYRAIDHHGHVVNELPGRPAFESFFPYFPLMSVFGLPAADTHESKGLTDARLVMSLMTLLTSLCALCLLRLTREQKLRVAQVLLVLPSGALFLSTGGDDMPILALMLLGVAALQRRQSNLAGISLGLAAALKLTAWPMAAGALLVARNKEGRATWKRVLGWITAIVVVTTVPFVLRAPAAFMANVFAFPLGFAGVTSPAASALPGHLLTSRWPELKHVIVPVSFLVGGYFATRYLKKHWPLTLSQLLGLLSVIFAVTMCVATATRIGYVIYPLNFWLWSACTRVPATREAELVSVV